MLGVRQRFRKWYLGISLVVAAMSCVLLAPFFASGQDEGGHGTIFNVT